MKRFSRIEELEMRNAMHTVEWTGDIKFKQKNIDKVIIDKYFDFNGLPKGLLSMMFELGVIVGEYVPAFELKEREKIRLKKILMNENEKKEIFGIKYEVEIHCTYDGDEIDFNILSDGSKEYILDMIIFGNTKEGTFIEVVPEPIEDEEIYPQTYSSATREE